MTQELIDRVLEQIRKDIVINGDVTGIQELLYVVPVEYLEAYLPEEQITG